MSPVHSFPPDGWSPAAARQFVRETLDGRVAPATIDNAVLVVSELVSNAVMHAGTEIEVAVEVVNGTVRVVVADHQDAAPVPRRPDGQEATGRGLGIVEELSEAWGSDAVLAAGRLLAGKAVWAEIEDR